MIRLREFFGNYVNAYLALDAAGFSAFHDYLP